MHRFEDEIRWLGYPPASHASKATRKRFPVGTALHDLRLPEDVSPMSSGRPIKADRWRDIPPRDVRDKIPESRACWIEAGTRFTLLFNSKDVLIAVWEDPVGPG